MITLYHGGDNIIRTPEIRKPNRTLDFGSGFYLTTSETQACDWVRRRFGKTGHRIGYVGKYSFNDTDAIKELSIRAFEHPDDDWLDFVMANRRNPDFTHDFDIVAGPVANDRVYTAFALFEGGAISRDILINELKTYRLVDQYLFHTPRSLEFLKFLDAKEVTL